MTKANKDRNDANVKALLDKIIAPLTKVYVDGQLDDRTRVELIKFLSDTRDPRSKEAWIKGCTGFAEAKGASEDDVRWIAPAIGATKLEEAAPALGQAFIKLEAGTQKGSQAYKNVHDAMLQLASPQWKGIIVERLNHKIDKPAGAGDNAKVTTYQNELFWQTTSAELAGELKDPAAVKPLFKCVMTPSKADVTGTASMALIKMGGVPFLINVTAVGRGDRRLRRDDVRREPRGPGLRQGCGRRLGAIGRAEAGPHGAGAESATTTSPAPGRTRAHRPLTTPESQKAFGRIRQIAPAALASLRRTRALMEWPGTSTIRSSFPGSSSKSKAPKGATTTKTPSSWQRSSPASSS
jgi:hypothetical protein